MERISLDGPFTGLKNGMWKMVRWFVKAARINNMAIFQPMRNIPILSSKLNLSWKQTAIAVFLSARILKEPTSVAGRWKWRLRAQTRPAFMNFTEGDGLYNRKRSWTNTLNPKAGTKRRNKQKA